jgi:hypothetical protein
MRRRAIPFAVSIAGMVAILANSLGGAGAAAPAPYSKAWLALNHSKFDTTLTAQYETALQSSSLSAASFRRASPTNVRMSSAAFAGSQNEFQISINPTNHMFAVGASNDGRTSGTGYYRTSDAGATWFSADMPGIGTSCCDPGVAYADDGNVYFINLDTSPAVVHFMRSTDNGVTWTQRSTPAVVDRPNIAIDNNPASPHHGRIYLTWSKLDVAPFEIDLNYSDDGGLTWSPSVNVSHVGGSGSIYAQSSNPTVASDGTVYVGFQYYPAGTKDSAQNRIAKSTDGGVSFTPSTIISAGPHVQGGLDLGDARGYFAIDAGCSTFRHRSFPIIKTSPTTPSTVYAAWGGGELESAYTCGALHGFHSDTLFSKSTDSGATWSAPLKVNDDPSGKDQYYPWMDVTASGAIFIGWSDRRDDPSNFKSVYYLDRSFNGGASFGTDKRVGNFQTLPSTFIGDYQGLSAVKERVLPMWYDSRNSSSGDPYTALIKGA